MTIWGLTKRKGGKTTLAQLLENKIGGKKEEEAPPHYENLTNNI